ncbi:hypothetical protein F2Q68_00014104 [Brassica cretica]|uniref:Uncharacterized protein n=1 Tax=Brassica cretica TaxID=69181 RepID=A0A8S9HLW3_BRACR|nr:hypothetical protein F2Q68_00014104 [Brassica cretica]
MRSGTLCSTCLSAWPAHMQGDTMPSTFWMHGLAPCKETTRPPHARPHASVACIATSRAWPFHLVLLCVTPHAVIIFTATPHASLDTYHARQFPPPPDLINRATSSFSVHSSNFGLSGEFFIPRSIPIFFDARSDDLNIFNKLQMNPDLTENIFRASGIPEKFIIPKLGFPPNFGFSRRALISSCLLPILLTSHPAYFPSCLDFVLLPTYDVSELIFHRYEVSWITSWLRNVVLLKRRASITLCFQKCYASKTFV